jgi:hypothetical protein
MQHRGGLCSWIVLLAAIGLLAVAPEMARAQLVSSGQDPLFAPQKAAPNNFGRQVHFVPNSFLFWNSPLFATTELPVGCSGSDCSPIPAYADVLLENSNFVQCKGGPYALCYYSGPDEGGSESTNLSCELTSDGQFANCNCYAIPYGTYFVDLNAILNYSVYLQTIAVCGVDGSRCSGKPNLAPVCRYINNNKLIPGADMVSTFSFDCIGTDGIGSTNCTQAEPYAGCMTAPCHLTRDTAKTGIVQCSCPIYDGPYQVGLDNEQCTLDDNLVWSAAYNPNLTGTSPSTTGCFPDAPGTLGCPLLPPAPPPYTPPAGINCKEVCQEYTTCRNSKGIEAGYTCDSTLCTAQCNDRDLSQAACKGLTADGQVFGACDISEIAKAEEAAGCSCCASQLCGCSPNKRTNKAIYDLVQRQRQRGINSQCDQNGTLCGTPR